MKKKILVIDDNEEFRQLVLNYLDKEGYDIHLAEDGRVAKDMLEQMVPDLIITDIVMPEMDGFEIINEIRKRSLKSKIFVITGGGRVEADIYLDLSKEFQVDCRLKKPVSFKHLLQEIKQHIG